MDANFPSRPLIGLLLRLVYQHYSEDIHAALREAGFGDIRPHTPTCSRSCRRKASPSRISPSSPGCASRRWPRRSSNSSAWATSSGTPTPRDRRSQLVVLTERGASVKPVTYATAARVEERWAQLTSPEELEALRASLLHLLTELKAP
jgi:hypothetical protein